MVDLMDLQRFIEDEINGIRDDHTNGASVLAARAAFIVQRLWSAAETHTITLDDFRDLLLATARRLATVRAGMAPMAHLAARVAGALVTPDRAQWLPQVELARRAFAAATSSGPRLATEFVARLREREHVVTLSRSATVSRALNEAITHPYASGVPRLAQIAVLESRPGNEGVTVARDLAPLTTDRELRITLWPDAAVAEAMRDATCCLIGADALLAEGNAVNKVGSHPLALAARTLGLPCYVLTDTTKIAPEGWTWQPEMVDTSHMIDPPITGVTVIAPLFERIPLALVTVITEQGQLDATAIGVRARELAAGYRLIA